MVVLAVAGFAAGFFGPGIFVPEANQGPLAGILISGPAGFVVGAALWALCALFKPSARLQWRMLYAVATIVVLITLFCVQPGPKVRGYVFDGEVESCAPTSETDADVLRYWDGRIAQVDWAKPRAGWRADMQRQLREAPGVVLTVQVQRTSAIMENRKPWNSGSQVSDGWKARNEETPFYDANGSCDQYPDGSAIRGYQESDADDRIRSANIWPPQDLLYVLSASALLAVPGGWESP